MRALPETFAKTHMRAAFDRLARDVAVRVGIAIIALASTLVYLVLALNAAGAAGPTLLLYATLTAGIAAAACGALAPLVGRSRLLQAEISRLEEQLEDLRDRNWELREAEERARSFLEAQGDLIARRDKDGHITYANDAFCALAGRSREELIGGSCPLGGPGSDLVVLPDGTAIHDQELRTEAGPRWIA